MERAVARLLDDDVGPVHDELVVKRGVRRVRCKEAVVHERMDLTKHAGIEPSARSTCLTWITGMPTLRHVLAISLTRRTTSNPLRPLSIPSTKQRCRSMVTSAIRLSTTSNCTMSPTVRNPRQLDNDGKPVDGRAAT